MGTRKTRFQALGLFTCVLELLVLSVWGIPANIHNLQWGLTAMAAAEHNFPSPPSSPPWISLATNVFKDITSRWNTTQCGGGLKWQFYPENKGFDYKSTITNAAYFQLAARLARYTGEATYATWAEKTWDWMTAVGLIGPNYNVYDGTDDMQDCSSVNQMQWSYNTAALLYGSAAMANVTAATSTSPWESRTSSLLAAAYNTYFSPFDNATNVMWEAACEKASTCNTDQFSFKAYLSRWMFATARMLPALGPDILSLMVPTARAAAQTCVGGTKGTECGSKWWYAGWDGSSGVGQQMSALEAVHGLLLYTVRPLAPAPAAGTAKKAGARRRRHLHPAKSESL